MRHADLAAAEAASARLFFAADQLSRRMSEPEIEPRSAEASSQWLDRIAYCLAEDPGGCWVAVDGPDDDASVIGFAISQNRGQFWYLATFGVVPEHQGKGIGKQLIDATLAHAAGRLGMFSSTVHPGATRRYWLAGFRLLPQTRMVGTVNRATLPMITGLHEGDTCDLDWIDRLDTQLRGAGQHVHA